jgi:antitoxin component of MazEF toxin-antitoxin module
MSPKPFSRTVQQFGPSSIAVTIPADVAADYGIEPGDELPVDLDRDEEAVKFLLTD